MTPDLVELIMGVLYAHASVTRATQAEHLEKIREDLERTWQSIDPTNDIVRDMLLAYIEALDINGAPPEPDRPPTPRGLLRIVHGDHDGSG